jgi:hypothetical protein
LETSGTNLHKCVFGRAYKSEVFFVFIEILLNKSMIGLIKEDLFQLNQSVLFFTYSGEPYFSSVLSRTEEKAQKGIPPKDSTKKSS